MKLSRSLRAYRWPGRFVLLLVFSFLSISAAPYPPGPALPPPPRAPEHPIALEPAVAAPSATTLACSHCTFLPAVAYPLDPFDRNSVLRLYNRVYLAATPPMGWTGNLTPCNPGTTSTSFQNAVMRRINYYRTMAGVPEVQFSNALYNKQVQEAAYMMSVNRKVSSSPDSTWQCYTTDGGDGAKTSFLWRGKNGPDAIHIYMDDNGQPNLGYRRWILYPQTREMATGDVSGDPLIPETITNATKAWDSNYGTARPETRYPYVAWPPPGYVPYTVINDYWSFSYPGADFSQSSVSVTLGGTLLAITPYLPVKDYGENTLVWKINAVNGDWPDPGSDTSYVVTVTNVAGSTYRYTVTVFDPGS